MHHRAPFRIISIRPLPIYHAVVSRMTATSTMTMTDLESLGSHSGRCSTFSSTRAADHFTDANGTTYALMSLLSSLCHREYIPPCKIRSDGESSYTLLHTVILKMRNPRLLSPRCSIGSSLGLISNLRCPSTLSILACPAKRGRLPGLNVHGISPCEILSSR